MIKWKFASIAKAAGHIVKIEQRVCPDSRFYRTDVSIINFKHTDSKGVSGVPGRVEFDFAVTDPTGPTNLSKALVQGIAANHYTVRKMNGEGAKNVHAPDTFLPMVMDSYGLAHGNFRSVLSSIAETHLRPSVLDSGFSSKEFSMLKGIIVNNYYQLISVAAVKGAVNCLNRAAQRVLSRHDARKVRSVSPLSHARAQCLIGASLRAASSSLTEFG